MASSLINGLIASGHAPESLWVSDINPDTLVAIAAHHKINTTQSNDMVVNEAGVVVLAVKPQVLADVAKGIAGLVQKQNTLVISIAAGISQQSLSQWLGSDTAIVRCMPNTPALVLTGATVLNANRNVHSRQRDLAESILRSVGIALWVENESELDAVTAVSGSGPAYFFLLMEAMEKTALELGLNHEMARLLVQQTALGAAKIALESAESPEQLRNRVTSPGGTTEQAIETFVQGGFIELVSKALHAAHERSVEISRQAEKG